MARHVPAILFRWTQEL